MIRRLFRFPTRTARDIHADVEAELRFHIDERTEALVALGLDPGRAREQALREFGDVDDASRFLRNLDRHNEAARRRRDHMGELRSDVRYALRKLRATPAFSITAIATLALGIGANTAIFSVVNGVLLRPLPFPHAEQVVKVWSANRSGNSPRSGVSAVDLDDWRAQKQAIADVGGYFYQDDGGSGIDFTGAGEPERLGALFFTPGFFGALAVPPQEGRLPTEQEMVRGGPDRVVVLSHRFWERKFAMQRSVIGTSIQLKGEPYQVLGVMPPGFRFPTDQADVYVPYSTIPDDAIPRLRFVRVMEAVARVREGHSIAEGRAELNTIAGRLARQYPDNAAYDGATVESLQQAVTGPVRGSLLVLLGAVAFVLLMACVNVASLLLARAAVREREFAIRAALGAGRARIIRQLLTESLVLSLAGGALGLGIASGGVRLLVTLAAGQLPRAAEVRLDAPVLAFALGLSVLTGLLFGVVPAIRSSATRLHGGLRDGGRGMAGVGGQGLRHGLVVAEVALAMMLVVGAGLMTRSFVELLKVDPGFRPDHLVAVNFTISTARHPAPQYRDYYRAVIEKVRELPGVVSAGATKNAPFRGSGEQSGFTPPGLVLGRDEQAPTANFLHISDGYFKTIGARMVDGREFTPADRADSPSVVVVNQALAARWFPGASAVGRTLSFGGRATAQIVGVVNDIRQTAMDEPAKPSVYLNNQQNSRVKTTLVVRTKAEPLAMAKQVREAIWSLDKDQTITSVFTFDDVMGDAVARPRLLTVLLGLFGAIGLMLGALGIYGVLAFLVNQRQKEIGVRLALGADAGEVQRMIVGRGVALAAGGVAIGLACSLAVTRFLRGVLYGVGPNDPLTFVVVAAMLVAVAALASWLPARRAARVDPVVALRSE